MNTQPVNSEQAILEAAEKEFIEKGYAASKTTEIARRAGVTHAMLHYYFRTKENLFNKVFWEKARLVAGSFGMILDEDLPFEEKIIKSIGVHFDFLAANPQLPYFIISEIFADPQRKEAWRQIFLPIIRETVEKFAIAIGKEVEKGNIRPVDPVELIISIVSLNIFVFLARPLVETITDELENKEMAEFLENRKKENIMLILGMLRPVNQHTRFPRE